MTILGLDLANKWGWAVVDAEGQYVNSGHQQLSASAPLGQRMHGLHLSLADLVTDYQPDFIVIETPHSPDYGAARVLFAYAGIAAQIAYIRERGYQELARSTVYKTVLGKGNLSKAEGVKWARQHKPLLNSDDESDAMLVAFAAHTMRET